MARGDDDTDYGRHNEPMREITASELRRNQRARDNDTPTPPPSPKRRVGEPLKVPTTRDYVAKPTFGEGLSATDLALSTRGPIASQRSVEKDVGDESRKRFMSERARNRATDRMWSRPYQLRGGRR